MMAGKIPLTEEELWAKLKEHGLDETIRQLIQQEQHEAREVYSRVARALGYDGNEAPGDTLLRLLGVRKESVQELATMAEALGRLTQRGARPNPADVQLLLDKVAHVRRTWRVSKRS